MALQFIIQPQLLDLQGRPDHGVQALLVTDVAEAVGTAALLLDGLGYRSELPLVLHYLFVCPL